VQQTVNKNQHLNETSFQKPDKHGQQLDNDSIKSAS